MNCKNQDLMKSPIVKHWIERELNKKMEELARTLKCDCSQIIEIAAPKLKTLAMLS